MQRYIYAILLLFISSDLLAQQQHYWTNQFGSRSALMGGAVVGGVRDTSASYYNPGALGFVKKSSFSVSANAYQVELMSIDNGAGTDEPREIESRKLNIIPLLISGTTTFGNNTFGYSLIGKNQSSIKLSGRRTEIADILNSNNEYIDYNGGKYSGTAFEGTEDYRGQFSYTSEVTEMLGGLSWSTHIYPNISFGVSGFIGYRTQSFNNSKVARATNIISKSIASEDEFSDADFYNVRTFLKFGIAADFNRLKLGATLTTPSMNLFGSGSVGSGSVRFKEDNIQYGMLRDDRQNDLDATYKTPMSLALGMEYQLNNQTLVATTLEWFAEQSRYNVITPRSNNYIVGSEKGNIHAIDYSDSKKFLTMQDGAASIVNFAAAVEHDFSNKITGYLSFRTDFETFQGHEGELEPFAINNWDIYHTTIGIVQKKKDSESAIGLVYSFGSQNYFKQLANLNPAERERDELSVKEGKDDFILASEEQTSADYGALSLIIGYTYFFK